MEQAEARDEDLELGDDINEHAPILQQYQNLDYGTSDI